MYILYKGLKILKRQSETVIRRTGNTMAERKMTKGQAIQWMKEK
jgi:hypothetical protein